MLDPRVYRAALALVLPALIVAAFSLQDPPGALTTSLAPDAFDGGRAFVALRGLEGAFPSRRPGSAGDAALAARVEQVFRGSELRVRKRSFKAQTADGERTLETVIGVRPGLSTRQIVVLAHRDALASPATADLSATAGLLELARVFQGRSLNSTLTLVSTSGGSAGAAGAADFARNRPGAAGPISAVIVLGDLAGTRVHKPLVVPWSNGVEVAPLQLRRTLEKAVETETGARPGAPRSGAQFARLAFPLTTTEQGELLAQRLPAVLVGASGERGPGAERAVSKDRLQALGRAVLRSITAIDATGKSLPAPHPELVARGKVVPPWAVRLLVAALLAPALLIAIDGFARVRRRRQPVAMWARWVLCGAVPFLAALVFLYVLALTGLLPARPPAPPPAGAVPLDARAIVALAGVGLVLVLGWVALRPLALRTLAARGDPTSNGAAAALLLVFCGIALVVWISNPYAAALLVPAAHLWLLVLAPEVRLRRSAALAIAALGLLPAFAIVVYYVSALGLGPAELCWTGLLLVAGGHVGPLAALVWCVLLGCVASLFAIVWRIQLTPAEGPPPTTRGPVTYAGPGSLGGTESALRR